MAKGFPDFDLDRYKRVAFEAIEWFDTDEAKRCHKAAWLIDELLQLTWCRPPPENIATNGRRKLGARRLQRVRNYFKSRNLNPKKLTPKQRQDALDTLHMSERQLRRYISRI